VFVGYEQEQCSARVVRYKVSQGGGEEGLAAQVLLVLDQTPFYAESGGQMGDSGTLTTEHGLLLRVEDTVKWNDLIVHRVGADSPFPLAELAAPLAASVDSQARSATRRNHTATHLLQAALRKALGTHVQQSGSRVDQTGLRFDFTHFKAPSPEELAAAERQVNAWVCESHPVVTVVKPVDQAKAEGAMALFGEKYGENVRVVSIDAVSKELCGGTHVASTGHRHVPYHGREQHRGRHAAHRGPHRHRGLQPARAARRHGGAAGPGAQGERGEGRGAGERAGGWAQGA